MRPETKWTIVLVVIVVGTLALLALPSSRRKDEPFQDGKPLGEWLEDLQNTADVEGQCRAARSLAKMGPAAAPAVRPLIAALTLQRGTDALRAEAAMALRAIGKQAIPALVETVTDPDQSWTVRAGAARVVGLFGPAAADATPDLLDYLRTRGVHRGSAFITGDRGVLWEVASALIKIGKDPDETIPAVLGAVKEDLALDPRAPALLNEIVHFGPDAVTGLRTVRDGPDALARVEAATLLHRVGVERQKALALLAQGLKDLSWEVRARAALRLGDLGREAAPAVPALIQALNKAQHPVLGAVTNALKRIGPPAVPALAALLSGDDRAMRRLAAFCLVEIRPEGTAVLRNILEGDDAGLRALVLGVLVHQRTTLRGELGDWLTDPNPRVRELSAVIISSLPTDGMTPNESWDAARAGFLLPLLGLLDDPAASLRREGATALGRLGKAGVNAAPHLVLALKDTDPAVRIEAALALWRIDGRMEPNMPVLLESLKAAQPDIRARAAAALGAMGAQARTAIPALRHLLKDEDRNVREAAAAALQAIGTNYDEKGGQLEEPAGSTDGVQLVSGQRCFLMAAGVQLPSVLGD
jgi:HEAT repeat protein